MARVVTFVLNDVRSDARVLREAATLAAAGHDVTVIGRPTDLTSSAREREMHDGFVILRVPVPGGLRRRMLEAGGGRAAPARASRDASAGRSALRRLVRAGRSVGRLPVVGAGVEGLDWLVRWRFGVGAWGSAAADAAGPADVWHAHDLTALPAALRARALHGGRIVYDSHELFLEAGWSATRPRWAKELLRRFERRGVAAADAVVTVNDALAEVLVREYEPRRVVVVHNCPPRRDATPPADSPLRAAPGMPPKRPVALLHGSLAPHRGVDVLVAALREPGMEHVHGAFLGSGSERASLEAAAADPAIGGRVHVLDPVEPSAVVEWVAGADVGVMPIAPSTLNHRLSTPNKLFECLAAGVPVVASDFAAIRPIVDGPDGPLGRLVDPTSARAVAAAIAAIVDASAEERAALRQRCLAAAHRRWNWETEGAQLLGLYEDLVGAPDAGGSAAPRRERVTFVLPTSGRFDSRTRRLAAGLHARGHEVRVLAREESDGAERPVELVPGVPLVGLSADPADGLPGPLPMPVRRRIGRALATAEARARRVRTANRIERLVGEGLRILAVAVRARAQEGAAVRADAGADVYHAMGFLALPVALRLARAHPGSRLIYDARDVYAESNNIARLPRPLRALFARRERSWARRADAILTVNDGVADLLAARWGVVRPTVVMNCSPAWTPPDQPPDLLRAALDLPAGTPVVLYHGGFMPDRGLPELVAAMRHPGLERAHLVLLGSGALDAELRRLAAEPAAGGRVHVLPPVPPEELLAWVASADVGVMPNQPRTLNERLSTPNKLFECLAAGLPVVSSDFPERRRIILLDPEGPLGAVCDPTDPGAIAAATSSILDLPRRERVALRARVLRAAHARYTWEPQLEQALEAYRRLVPRASHEGEGPTSP